MIHRNGDTKSHNCLHSPVLSLGVGWAVVTRAPPKAYDAIAKYTRAKRVDVSMLYLSSHVISHAHDLLVSYRARLEQAGRGPYLGGDTPSSGAPASQVTLVGVTAL